jgi:hypothetical protein
MGKITTPSKGKRSKTNHVLARILDTLGELRKESMEVLGISEQTVKAIQSKKLTLSEKVARTIEEKTGVSRVCLLENNHKKPLRTFSCHAFSRAAYDKHVGARKNSAAIRTAFSSELAAGLSETLAIKMARLMVAANSNGEAGSTFNKLEREIARIGKRYPVFESLSGLEIHLRRTAEKAPENMQLTPRVIFHRFKSAARK